MAKDERKQLHRHFTEDSALRTRIDRAKISSEPHGWEARIHPPASPDTTSTDPVVQPMRLGSPSSGRIRSTAILAAQDALALFRLA